MPPFVTPSDILFIHEKVPVAKKDRAFTYLTVMGSIKAFSLF